jgi:hypothetical protein
MLIGSKFENIIINGDINEYITFEIWSLKNDYCDHVHLRVDVVPASGNPPSLPTQPPYARPMVVADSMLDFQFNHTQGFLFFFVYFCFFL